jgi:hypothetical protein
VTSTATPVVASDAQAVGRVGEVVRDIARGGLAGAVVGIVVAGLGGRIVMRLAAIIVPTSDGQFTENGNLIGHITLSGSLGLILFGGLFFGLFGGTVWVVISPWIPGTGLIRAILAMPIAVALTGMALVQGDNPDFRILQHDGLVVAMLLALVGLAGLTIALVDEWLERRLPRAGSSTRMDALYAVLTLAGGLLILPALIQAYFVADVRLGLALVAVGLATLGWWALRFKGRARERRLLVIAGRVALLAAVAFGVLDLAPEVAAALGVS